MEFLKKLKFWSSEQKNYDKYGDVLKRILSTKEQREEAVNALVGLKPEYSVPQLLKRFELVVDSGLQDEKEKKYCFDLIVKHGEEAKESVKLYLSSKPRISWTIKMAEKLFSHEEFLELLMSNLNTDMTEFDEQSVERNIEILLALKDMHHESIAEKVKPFLNTKNDEIRLAALECFETQAEHYLPVRQTLLELVNQPVTDDNSRFMGVISSIIEKHKWR